MRLDKSDYSTYTSIFDMFHAWQDQAAKLEQGEITKEENDQWRYKYPELDTSGHWAKVPSQAVSDMPVSYTHLPPIHLLVCKFVFAKFIIGILLYTNKNINLFFLHIIVRAAKPVNTGFPGL